MRLSVGKDTINNAKKNRFISPGKKSYGLLIHNPNISHVIKFLKKSWQKVSWNISSSQKCSLTLETALAFPLFLFAVLQLYSIFLIYKKDTEEMMKIMQTSRYAASYVDVTENIIDGITGSEINLSSECIDLYYCYDASPLISLTGEQLVCIVRARMRKFNGYDNIQNEEQEKCVYVTENRDVYHVSIHCSYLQLSIQETTVNEISSLHNSEGENYKPCAYCTGSDSGTTCYITEDGNHYHYDLTCSGLTRKISMVTYQEAEDLPACSRCGGKE